MIRRSPTSAGFSACTSSPPSRTQCFLASSGSSSSSTRPARRKRDLLLLFVPFVNVVVAVQSVWRYTARSVYWQPRDDRPSAVLSGTARTLAIVGGWILGPLFFVLVIIGAITAAKEDGGWSDLDRSEFQAEIEGEGVDDATARCVTDYVIERFPDGPEALPGDEDDLADLGEEAFKACG